MRLAGSSRMLIPQAFSISDIILRALILSGAIIVNQQFGVPVRS
jgi:hypothetical protein